jgi:hypothetical protein
MDLLAELDAGMTWRRFRVLLAGLSGRSVYRALLAGGPTRVYTAENAADYFARFPKADPQ